MLNRQRVLILFGILVSAIFLFLAFQNLKPQDFFNSLSQINLALVVLGAGVYFGAVALISWRWQFLLNPIQKVPWRDLFQLVSIGYMGNNVYPLRAGEALRIFLLRRNHNFPIFRSTTVTIVERIFDGIVMLTFILVGVSSNNLQNDTINTVVRFATPIFGVGLVVFLAFALFPNLARSIRSVFIKPLPTRLRDLLVHLSDEVLEGLAGLQNPLQLGGAVFASYASWMVEALVYWIVLQAFGFDLNYTVALLVVGTVNLAGLIPASPGQIGVYEFFASSVLMAFGIAQERALSFAIVVHIVIWLPITVAGFVFLARQGLGFSAISHAKELETS
jgi:glycosyltransferase 2 family protein